MGAGPLGLAVLLLAAHDYAGAQSGGTVAAPALGLYLTAFGGLLAVLTGFAAFKSRPLAYRS